MEEMHINKLLFNKYCRCHGDGKINSGLK